MNSDRLKKLARTLDALPEQDSRRLAREQRIEQTRQEGASLLHRMCDALVGQVNQLVTRVHVELSPETYHPAEWSSNAPTLFQLNVNGRIVQMTFSPTELPTSVENFRIPYTLEGTVHWFNQEVLERAELQEHLLFYCLDRNAAEWRYYDPHSHRTGKVDEEYFAGLLESLA